MYTSTFMFQAKEFDADFHELNNQIAEQAREIPGWRGEESWHSDETGLHSEVYYWESLEALRTLIGLTEHKVAKAAHARWIGDYRVVIAEVLSTYGTPGLGIAHAPS
jgi:heme-degrading monooxygenase HmoA